MKKLIYLIIFFLINNIYAVILDDYYVVYNDDFTKKSAIFEYGTTGYFFYVNIVDSDSSLHVNGEPPLHNVNLNCKNVPLNKFFYNDDNSRNSVNFVVKKYDDCSYDYYSYTKKDVNFCSKKYQSAKVFFHSKNGYQVNCIGECLPGYKDVDGKCVPACNEDEIYNSQTKECIKRPWWCPKPMIYQEYDPGFLKAMVKSCTPDPSISEDECSQKNLLWHSWTDLYGAELGVAMRYPQGCYHPKTVERFKAENQLENDSFVWSGLLFPLPINAIKNGWNSLSEFFANFLKGKNYPKSNQSLLDFKPKIIDFELGPNGPKPKFDFEAIEPKDIAINSFNNRDLPSTLPNPKPGESFSDYLKRSGFDKEFIPGTKFDKTPQDFTKIDPNLKKLDLPYNQPITSINNNSFVSAKLQNEPIPMPTKKAVDLNDFVKTDIKIDLDSVLKNSNKKSNLPITIRKVSENGNKSVYKGAITTPDKSIVDVDIVETKTPGGRKTQDVTIRYPYTGPKKQKYEYNGGYTITIDSNGGVTNTITKDSTIYNPTTNTTIINNNTNTITPNVAPDLSNIVNAINRVGSKIDTTNNILNDIKAQQKAEWEYNPGINVASALSNFNSEMLKFNSSLDDVFKFVEGLKDNINDAKGQIDDAINIIENGIDSPEIPRGTCPFDISGPAPGSGKTNTFTIDPCRFVSPYKPILTLFFTAILSWFVLIFSLKYLFHLGGK